MTTRTGRRSGERALSVIEVLIAVVLLMAVASAIGLAAMGGNKLRGAARLQVALTGTGKQIQEDISTNRGWMDACRTINVECDVRAFVDADSLQLDDVEGAVTLERATATPLDSDVDGVGAADRDGLLPDYFRIRVVVRPEADVASRYSIRPEAAERTIVTTIDRRGDQAMGSLSVEVCRVDNQVDERMSIQGCARTGISSIRMADCAPLASACAPVFSWVAAQAASSTERSPFVVMQRVSTGSLNFTVHHDASGWSRSSATATEGADGRLTFDNVPAGDLRVAGLPTSIGGNTERWKSKELPGFLGSTTEAGAPVVVEPGVQSRALVIYRPAITTQGVNLQFQRRTRTLRLTGPHNGYNRVVNPWAPTHTYRGGESQRICDAYARDYGRFDTTTCDGSRPGPGANCSSVYISGDYYHQSSRGRYWAGQRGGYYIPDAATLALYPEGINAQQRYRYQRHRNVRIATACTYYWQEYFTTYYNHGGTSERIRAGIAQPLTYSMTPMPENRATEVRSQQARSVVPQCVVGFRRPTCDAPTEEAPFSLARLVPGLNQGVLASHGSYPNPVMSVPESEAANVARGASPAAAWNTLRSGALWVRPDGSMLGSNGGTIAAGTNITLTGEGECYWTSPRFSGEREGSCNPCVPLWDTGLETPGCSILTRIRWHRHVKETVQHYSFPTGARSTFREEDLPGADGVLNFDPPQVCTDPAPVVIGRCRSIETRTIDIVPATDHVSGSTGGTGGVASHGVNESPT